MTKGHMTHTHKTHIYREREGGEEKTERQRDKQAEVELDSMTVNSQKKYKAREEFRKDKYC